MGVTCAKEGRVELYPIDGGPPTVIQTVAGTPGPMSWQRVAN